MSRTPQPRRSGPEDASAVIHLLLWAFAGLLIGATAWLVAPARPPLRLPTMTALGSAGAVTGGLIAWALREFPPGPFAGRDLLTAPVLTSYLVAVVGALAMLSAGYGIASRASR
jgi:uncharacterized membrane protein YeaQ/YmgE (transglycosylase-associated protein family)